jgi:hypothetical protein
VSDLAPPERPSYAWPVTFVTACALALGFVCLLAWLDGCAATPTPSAEAVIAAYGAEQEVCGQTFAMSDAQCVESSTTLAGAKACRASAWQASEQCRGAVRVKYGRSFYAVTVDGGAR